MHTLVLSFAVQLNTMKELITMERGVLLHGNVKATISQRLESPHENAICTAYVHVPHGHTYYLITWVE